jgi:hypothetical protein
MKWAALLKGSGSLLSNIRFIIRCNGKNVSRKRPARAITNFFVIEENKILLIVIEIFMGYLFTLKWKLNKNRF